MQSAFNKENKFNGELKQFIDVTIQIDEQYAWQYTLHLDQMINLFMHCLDGPPKLLFLRSVKPGFTYVQINKMMLAK